MSLSKHLRPSFRAITRSRGEAYFAAGRVSEFVAEGDHARATIDGESDTYEVALAWTDDGTIDLGADCDCPHFARRELCKHVWATLRAADGSDFATRRRGSAELRIGRADRGLIGEMRRAHGGDEASTAAAPNPSRLTRDWRGRLRSPAGGGAAASGELRVRCTLGVEGGVGARYPALGFSVQERERGDRFGRLRSQGLTLRDVARVADPAAREALSEILEAHEGGLEAYAYGEGPKAHRVRLTPELQEAFLPGLAASGVLAFGALHDPAEATPLALDEGGVFRLEFEVQPVRRGHRLRAALRRGEESLDVADVDLALGGGFLVCGAFLRRLEADTDLSWLGRLHGDRQDATPDAELDAFLERTIADPEIRHLRLPDRYGWKREEIPPEPCLRFAADAGRVRNLRAELRFHYGARDVGAGDRRRRLADRTRRIFVERDAELEARAATVLEERDLLAPAVAPAEPRTEARVPRGDFVRTVADLTANGWRVEAERVRLRAPGRSAAAISSGIDFFELRGGLSFGDQQASFPALLAALRKGEEVVTLGDGSQGLLPTEWLARLAPLAELGEAADDGGLRFAQSQALLLDLLVDRLDDAEADGGFETLRTRLASGAEIHPVKAPKGFRGDLRPYQEEGLGWLLALRELGMGGCLADDMGLGKTVQLLALRLAVQEQAPASADERHPFLVVAPKSVVFNWASEAARFAPSLRVLEYTGGDRRQRRAATSEADLVLTTYGTLLRDVEWFSEQRFDTVVLDEAQAIKNPQAKTSRAARALDAAHRLALTGTPVENHFGEAVSLFEFLNPGILGGTKAGKLVRTAGGRGDDATEAVRMLSKGLRPFLLRRTKAQVLPDLPPRTEQTLHCELSPREREEYVALRDHYRRELLRDGAEGEAKRSPMVVLEALLRLRQAACHPGLLDPARRGESSAKLDLLSERLDEVLGEGHKALVFSQFTSFLDEVRRMLDRGGVSYAYLDGSTTDREGEIARFQDDEDCRVFLVSLKAGGVGLNLTAADFVFLLDPWWNPAAEAQAIDRAHRIGQEKPVVAYRLVAEDTVEERVLELQARKREIADALLGDASGPITKLSVEDLELLLDG